MRRILAVCSVVGLLACACFAQAPQPAQIQRMTGQSALSTDSSDSADTIKALMQEVKELKARVAALEADKNLNLKVTDGSHFAGARRTS